MKKLQEQFQNDRQLFRLYEMGLDLDEIAYLNYLKNKIDRAKEWE